MRNPKIIFPIVFGIIGAWLIANSGTSILDTMFGFSDYTKFALGIGLILFGVIKMKR